MYVFHTVNAGIYLQEGDYGLLIDALHGGEGGFSRTPNEIMKHISRHTDSLAAKIDLAFTHLHGDHFNMERVSDFMDKYPRPRYMHRKCGNLAFIRMRAPKESVMQIWADFI